VIPARAERELAREIHAELAAIAPHRSCCRLAEAAAIAGFGWRARRARQAPLLRTALRLGYRSGDDVPTWRWDGSAEHCRAAYVRGLFLARGSLSLAEGRVHLEFVVEPGEAGELARRLRAMGLPASVRVRRGRGVVTWKSAETVATFLRMTGARTSILDLEARRVARLLRGELNRVLNAEAANLGRMVDSAARQLEAIDLLVADGTFAALPADGRAVARARREAPDASLGELAEATGLHRSTVQRELRRIEREAAERPVGGVRPTVEQRHEPALGGSI